MEAKDRKLQEYENKNLQLSKRLEETYSSLTQKITDAEREIARVSSNHIQGTQLGIYLP